MENQFQLPSGLVILKGGPVRGIDEQGLSLLGIDFWKSFSSHFFLDLREYRSKEFRKILDFCSVWSKYEIQKDDSGMWGV